MYATVLPPNSERELHTNSSRAERNSAPTAGPTTLASAPPLCGPPLERSIRPSLLEAAVSIASHPVPPSPTPNARNGASGAHAHGRGGRPGAPGPSDGRRLV